MSRHFTANILLERPWDLNIDAIASALRSLFPEIGEVDSIPGQSDGDDAGVLIIEGATIIVQSVRRPFPLEDLTPPLRPLRAAGADDAAARHRAHLVISAGGALPGLEGAEAYAAVVHFVAAACLTITPALAVFWKSGYALARAETFTTAANMLLHGGMPVGTWISFATVVPTGMRPEDGMGMVTYGMRSFIGRELELAPRPCDARVAFQMISAVCRQILNRGTQLTDGSTIHSTEDGGTLRVRERDFWLRRDVSALVLVSHDSIVDSETLKARVVQA